MTPHSIPASIDTVLSSARANIDALDARIQLLLQERTMIVEHVGALKHASGVTTYMRPAREHTVIKNLLDRHQGAMDKAVLVGLWREIMMASLQLECPFKVSVVGQKNWPLARNHFGSVTPLISLPSIMDAIHSIEQGDALLAVIPCIENNVPWWVYLANTPTHLSVVFQLPILINTHEHPQDAMVIGLVEHEPMDEHISSYIMIHDTMTPTLPTLMGIEHFKDKTCLTIKGYIEKTIDALQELAHSLAIPIDKITHLGHATHRFSC
jgi:chorismate mutase